ncbi:hypothetical protein C2S52_011577 [Perilla frutescens var. hirtella]|nr:hypothetical protein C2S52_011577 [Perilla frutescens var. hirtella]
MAYAALVSLAQTIDLITNYHQDVVSPQVNDQITSLQKHVIFLRESFEGFPDRAYSMEAKIKDVTHLAEDIIEVLLSDALLKSTVGSSKSKLKRQLRGRWDQIRSRYASLKSRVGSSKSKEGNQIVRYDFLELKKVTKEIESVAEGMMEIKNSITVQDELHGGSSVASSSSTIPPIRNDLVVGFDGELMEIKSRLCGEPSSKLEVIPIVGMGGIGKTTLAINAYEDPLIVERFRIRAWITVSQDYSVQEIVSSLLASMEVPDAQRDSMKQHHVFQKLKCRRYLIVLDDMWSTNAWDELKIMFPDDNNGSRVILTTRLLDVASYVNSSSYIHHMHLMDEDQSWNLLRLKVFKQDPCPHTLSYAGKRIAKSCRGLPLAIVVISEYYETRASKLIKLWVAEGFLKPERSKSLEETAQEYLEDLVGRSLVLVTERKSNGKIKSFSIHDLLREMCIRKAREEKFLLQLRGLIRVDINFPRRISIIHSDLDFLDNMYGYSTVRTIICLEDRRRGTQFSLGYFRLLRILDLINAYEYFYQNDNSSASLLPEELFELFHLRYLAFDYTFSIPAAISNLQNLQTLIIGPRKYRGYFVQMAVEIWRMPQPLPAEIWNMPQLRHLVFCSGLRLFQKGATFALENLQTLSLAINFNCSPEILKMIPNLKKLGLYYTRREYLHSETTSEGNDRLYSLTYSDQLKNITYLKFLENLKLKMHHSLPYPGKMTLRALPPTLKKLTLSGLKLPWKHMKFVGSLPNLQVLKLRDFACNGAKWETSEGGFCELRYLLISQSNLLDWITESSHFPRLKCLVLLRCPNLTEIPDDIGEIPTLELIEMDNWNTDLVDSAKQIQDDQQNCGNDSLQLRFV